MNRMIERQLAWEGYAVDCCFDGQEALDYLQGTSYDAVILDVMMPKKDGFEVLRTLRGWGDEVPVIFLTARDSVPDRVHGLDLGADDYLVKPFRFEELMARLRVMTRHRAGTAGNTLQCGDLVMDCARHTVTRGGKEITLAAKEYALLEYLLRNEGVVLSRDQIETNIWNYDYTGGSNVVDVYIRMLRKKVDEGFDEKLIQTVRGYGYVLRKEK